MNALHPLRRPGLAMLLLLLLGGTASCFGGSTRSGRDQAFAALQVALQTVLPREQAQAIQPDDTRLATLLRAALQRPDLILLVNKTASLKAGQVPADLVALEAYAPPLVLNKKGLEVRRETAEALKAMALAAGQAGVRLDVSSAYRSYDYQKKLFQRYVNELGEAEASRQSARAGTSQHQLGTTVDFGSITEDFADTRAGRWLAANAWQHGFSLSYPAGLEKLTGYMYEPWHYRYIGPAAAELEQRYFQGIQEHLLEFLNHSRPAIETWLSSLEQE